MQQKKMQIGCVNIVKKLRAWTWDPMLIFDDKMNIKINPKEIKELQDGEVIDKGDLIIFDKTVNVWQTMNREQLGCDVLFGAVDEKPMTLEEFKKRISEANDTWADSASELARDCFNYGKE